MEHVHYLPWVGENYSQGINGKRVMGLGEPIYMSDMVIVGEAIMLSYAN